MKVLAIAHNYPHKDDSSCGTFVQLQLSGLAKLGADIDLLVPLAYAPKFIAKTKRYRLFRYRHLLHLDGINEELIRYIKLPGKWYHRWGGLACYLSAKKRVLRRHREEPYDLIYGVCLFPEGDMAIRLGELLKIPVVVRAIGNDVNSVPHFGKSVYRRYVEILDKADGIVTSGHALAKEVSKVVSGKPIVPVFGLVDMDAFKPVSQSDQKKIRSELGLLPHCKILLFVGHLSVSKGVYELIDAFKELFEKEENLRLVLCGDGNERDNLERKIIRYGLRDKVILKGVISYNEVPKWMQASDMLILPSYSEGVPNVVMEAMACGLPVIATAVGGLPAAVKGSKGIILVQPKSVNQLKSAIQKVLENEELYNEMQENARKTAVERFDIKRHVNSIMECFNSVLSVKSNSLK